MEYKRPILQNIMGLKIEKELAIPLKIWHTSSESRTIDLYQINKGKLPERAGLLEFFNSGTVYNMCTDKALEPNFLNIRNMAVSCRHFVIRA